MTNLVAGPRSEFVMRSEARWVWEVMSKTGIKVHNFVSWGPNESKAPIAMHPWGGVRIASEGGGGRFPISPTAVLKTIVADSKTSRLSLRFN